MKANDFFKLIIWAMAIIGALVLVFVPGALMIAFGVMFGPIQRQQVDTATKGFLAQANKR